MATLMDLITAPKPLAGAAVSTNSIATAVKPAAATALTNTLANRTAAALGAQVSTPGTKSFTSAGDNPATGTDPFITNPTIALPQYNGVQPNQGRAVYSGLKKKPIVIKVTNPSATAGEIFKLWDYAGLSGISNGADIVVGLTSTNLKTAGVTNSTGGYTAANTLFAQKNPYFNRVRMSVDNKSQLDYEYTVSYYDENSRLIDNLTFVPSSAIVQEDQQTTIAEMGLEYMVTPNGVFTGSLDGNADAGYNSMTFYTLGYVWDTKAA